MGESLTQGPVYKTPTKLVCAVAGRGTWPTYAGAAVNYHICPALGDVHRLALLSYLTAHGPARTVHLQRAVRAPGQTHHNLHGMADMSLVQAQAVTTRGGRFHLESGNVALRWHATEAGRRWLWRAGWVTQRLFVGLWSEDNPFEACFPPHVLLRHARPEFLRPAALALANELLYWTPRPCHILGERLGLNPSNIGTRLRKWEAQGWTERITSRRERRGYCNYFYQPVVFRLTPDGKAALLAHANALRCAALYSGYEDVLNDAYYKHEDGGEWFTWT